MSASNSQLANLVPLAEQVIELRRELSVRNAVYPKWVRNGSLRFSVAQRRIAALQAAITTLERLRDDHK